MLLASILAAVRGFSSTFSLATRRRPWYFRDKSSRIGDTMRQGPHQGAHRSKRTGNGDSITACSNVRSVTATGVSGNKRAPHFPHFAAR